MVNKLISGTINGANDNTEALTITANDNLTISGAIGGIANKQPSTLDITTTGSGVLTLSNDITTDNDQTYTAAGGVLLGANVTLTATSSDILFSGTASTVDSTGSTRTLTVSANEIEFDGAVGGNAALGAIGITGALDLDADITSASSLSVSTTSNLAADVTTSGAQQYDGAVTLSADDTLTTTTDSNATFGSTIDSDDASTKRDLTLTLGSGSASVTGIVGATSLDVLTLNSSSSFTAAVTATSIVNAASKTATFSDNVTANITNSGTLLFDTSADKSVTGTIAEPGDGATGTEIKVIDSADGAPATVTFTATIAADTLTVGTSSKAGAALFEDDVTVPTINITGGDVDAEDSTVTFNTAVTSSSGITLDDNTGDAKVIFDQNNTVNIASTIDGGADNEGTIQVTGATKTFTSAIGGTYDVGTLDIDNTSIFNEAISATNINVASGITATAKKAITATAIVLDGGTLELSTTTTATIAGTINGNDTTEGVLHISGANKTFSGAIGTSRILTEIDIDGATIFNGTIKTVTLDTAAAAYALELNGAANVITNAVTFNNTGALTLGDANTDSSTFNGGITATAPSGVTLAGTIETDGNAISIGDGDTAITLAANTIIDGDANNDQVTDGAITLGGTVDGASTLTLNSTNTTTISAAIGSGTDITSLITDSGGTTVISADITSTGNQTYNDNVSLTTDITLTGGSQLTFAGTVNSSATDETTDADALSTSFTETAFEGEVGGTYGLGVIIITGALDLDAAITSASSLSVSTTSNLAADVTTSGAQQYDGAVTLSADNTLTTTTDSNATFGSTIDSDDASTKRDLTLTLGSGSASVTGIVGATSLDVLTLNSSSSFTAAVTATSIVNAASKTATFSDNVTANITNSGTLLFDTSADKSVTGTIAEPGDGATGTEIKVIDSADGAPATVTFTATIAADTLTVGTSSKAGAALFEDDVTVPTINITGGDVDAEDSTVTFNTAVTSSSGITLDDNTGDAKVIFDQNNTVNIASTIDGGADNEGTIQVTGATKTFTSAIGGTYDVGTLDIDNTSIFNEAISATNINVASGITATAKKAITATAIVLDGGTLELSTTTTATIAGTINGNDTTEGVLHISGANKTFSGAIGTSRILTEIDIDGATIFNGTIKTVTLDTAAAAYALELNGAANVITNAVTFNNTGALTLGDANTDSSTFNGGITATAPSGVTLAGTIETDGNAISIGDGDTAITLAANTIIDGDANNDQVTDGAITLGGTVDGASTLTLNSTNTTTISAAIGSGTDITSLITDSGGTTVISADITSTGNQTYNDNVSLTTDITLTGGSQLTFAGTVNSSATDETTDADALSTSFTETAFEGEVGGTYGLGVIIITGALDLDAAITSASSLSVSTTSNLAADVTTSGAQQYDGAVTLSADNTLTTTTDSNATFGSTIDSDDASTKRDLTLTLGSGSASVTGIVGATSLDVLTLNSSSSFTAAVTATSIVNAASKTATFSDNVTANITNSGTLLFDTSADKSVTGTIAEPGDGATGTEIKVIDSADGAPATVTFTATIAADTLTVGTSSKAGAALFEDDVTVPTINITGGDVDAEDSTVTFNTAVTSSSGITLDDNTGDAKVIFDQNNTVNIASTIDGGADNEGTIQVTGATKTFTSAIGGTYDVGTLDIDNTSIFNEAISATNINVASGITATAKKAITATAIVLDGGTLELSTTTTATIAGTINGNDTTEGVLHISGANKTFSGAIGTSRILTEIDIDGATIFNGTIKTVTLDTAAAAYALELNGAANVITNAVTFNNTGALTLGDANTDSSTFNGGITATAPSGVTLAGTIETDGNAISIGDGDTAITLAANTIIDGDANNDQVTDGAITLGGTVDGASTLTLNSTNTTTISAAIGSGTDITSLITDSGGTTVISADITSTGNQTYNDNVSLTTDITLTGGSQLTFAGTVNSSATDETTDADALSTSFTETAFEGEVGGTYGLGVIIITGALDLDAAITSASSLSVSTTSNLAADVTTSGAQQYDGAVTLSADNTLTTTTDSNATFGSTIDSDDASTKRDLTLTLGSGSASVTGIVGATSLDVLTLNSSSSFTAAVTATSIVNAASKTATFSDNVTANITNSGTLLFDTSADKSVTGTIAEPGDGATGTEIKVIDSADGAPATVTFTATIAADTLTVGTSSKAGAALFEDDVTVPTINITGGDVDAEDSTVTFNTAVTSSSGITLDDNTGDAKVIFDQNNTVNIASTIDGGADNEGTIQVTGATKTFKSAIGSTSVGTLNIDATPVFESTVGATTIDIAGSVTATFNDAITATTIALNGSSNLTISYTGAITIEGNITDTSTNNEINVLFATADTAPSLVTFSGEAVAADTIDIGSTTKAGKATFSGSTGVTATTLTIAGGDHENEDSTATFNDNLTATIVLDDNTGDAKIIFATTNNATITGTINGSATTEGTLQITGATKTFSGAIGTTEALTLIDVDNAAIFDGSIEATTLSVAASNYALELNGAANVITNTVTFNNTGALTLGDANTDSSTFNGGITATAPSGVTLAGTIETDGNAISIGDGDTAITLAANTIIDGDANNDQVTDGAITLGGTVDGASTLTLNSTNTTTISAAIGSGTDITSLITDSGGTTVISADITSTGNQTYNDNVSLTTDITLTGGSQLTFAGTVNSSATDETTDADALSTSFTETAFEGEVGGTYGLGVIIITGALDLDAAITSASSLSVSTTSNLAADVTTSGAQQYDGAVTLSADNTLTTTTDSNATFGSTIDSDDASTKRDLTLTLGSGSASVTGIVGATSLDVLTLNSSSSFTAAVTATSIVNAASKTATFSDNVTANITNSGTLLFDTSADKSVTGTIAEPGDGATGTEIKVIDSADGAPATVTFTATIAADTLTVGTSSKAGAALFEDDVTVPTINITGGDVDAEDSTVTFNTAVTSSSGITLDDNTGDAKVIFDQNNTVNIASTIDGGADNEGTIQVTGATKTFKSAIGSTSVGTLNIDATPVFESTVGATTIDIAGSVTATFNDAITATTIALNGSSNLTISYTGAITIEGNITDTSTNNEINVLFATADTAPSLVTFSGEAVAADTIDIGSTTKAGKATFSGSTGVTATTLTIAGGDHENEDSTATFNDNLTATIVLDDNTGDAKIIFATTNNATITGTINGSATTEGTLQITGATKTFSGAIGTTEALTLIDVDNAAIFDGSIEATTLSVAASNYALELNGAANVITNTVTFNNTGALTLGDANTDSSTFNGGITATAPSGVTLAGTIETDGNAISIGDGDTAITLAANTIIDGDANNDQVTDGAITLGGTVDGASTLTLNSTNTTTISAAIGSGTDITSLITDSGGTTVISADITSTGNQTYNDNVSLTTDITLTGGSQLTFAGTVNSSATDETTDADALSTSFTETAFEGEVGGTYGLGVIIITGALDLDAAITSASSLSVSTTSNLAADVTTSGAQQYDGAVTLSADNTLTTTTDSNATFGSTIDSDDASTKRDLTLTLGSGSASVTGIVGATSLDVLTLNSSSSFTAAVTATSIVNAASKTATFSDNVTANITNSGTLLFDTSADKSVTGTIAEPGDGATGTEIKVIDSADGAPATVTFTATIAADTLTVGTSSKAGAALFEDDVTVPTINITGGDVDAEDSTVTFNTAVTSSSGITLDDNTGDAKVIFDQNNTVNIASTIDGGADNEGTIQVTGATKTFKSAIGSTSVGTLNIDATPVFESTVGATTIDIAGSVTATFNDAITATTIALNGSSNLTISYTGAITIEGNITDTSTNNEINVLFATADTAPSLVTFSGEAVAADTIDIGSTTKAGKATFSGSTGVTATTLTIAGGDHENEDSTATFNDNLTATIVLDDNTGDAKIIFATTNNATITGTINGSATTEGTLQITGATKTFSGAIGTTEALTLIDVDNAAIFDGSIEATTLSVAASNYALELNGAANVITNTVTFNNTGALTLGDANTDSSTFNGGITATAPSGVTLAGTIETDGNAISIGDGDTAITLAANTIIDGDANNDQVTDGAITLGGTVDGASTLTLNSTNTTTISAAIGSGTDITSLITDSGGTTVISADITSTGNQTYNDNVSLTTDVTLTGGSQLTFAGTVNSSATDETTDADALSTSFTETAFEGEVGGTYGLGVIIITGALDLDAAITSASSLSVSTTSNLAADVTTSGAQQYDGAVTLSADNTLTTTTDSNATFGSTIDSDDASTKRDLTLTLGSGSASVTGIVGATSLDVLTLNSSSSFTAAVTATSIVNAASKTATFSDNVTANITNSGTLLFDTSADKSVTGTIAEPGDGATGTEIKVIDSADGAPATVTFTATIAADTLTVGTSSKAGAALFEDDVTVPTINITGGDVDAEDSTVTFNTAVTSSSGITLDDNTGDAKVIFDQNNTVNIASTIDGGADNEGTIQVTGATKTFTSAIGGTYDVGTLDIDNTSIFNEAISATNINVASGITATAKKAITATAIVLDGGTLELSTTTTATIAGTINGNDTTEGVLHISGANKTFSGAIGTSRILTEIDIDGATIFNGTIKTVTLDTAAAAYALELNGAANVITNAVTFNNTGALTLGDANTDSSTFNGGITATAPSGVTLAGTIETDGNAISIGDGDTAITLAANTIIDGDANNDQVTDGAITLGGTVDGASTLTLNSTNTTTISAAIGSGTDITSLITDSGGTTVISADITSTGNQTYNDNVSLTTDVTLTGGSQLTFAGTVNSSATDETTDADALSTSFTETAFEGEVGGTYGLGVIIITGALDLDAAITSASSLSVSTTSNLAADVTTSGAQQYDGAVTLSADNTLTTTTDSNATFGSTIDSDDASTKRDLTLTLGSGSASVTGIVGATSLDVLTLNSSSSFTAAVTATSIVNAASKTATFSDNVTANITNSGTLLFDTSADKSVTGTIAEPGDGATGTEIKVIDSADGAPATVTFTATIAADTLTVGTSSKAGAALFEDDVTVPTINITGGDVDAEDSTVTFNTAVTSSSGITLDDNTGDAKVIFDQNNTVNIASTIDGGADNEGTIQVTGATKTFKSAIGSTSVGTLNIDATPVFESTVGATTIDIAGSVTATFNDAITATTIALNGSSNLTISYTGAITIEGNITDTSTNNEINVLFATADTAPSLVTFSGEAVAADTIDIGSTTKAGKATFSGSTGVTATTLTIAGGDHENEDSTATFNDNLTATIVLDDNTGDAKIIFATTNNATITGTINGSATTEGTLQITGATKTFSGAIGTTEALTLIDVDNAAIFDGSIEATTLSVAASNYALELNGAANVITNTVTFNNTGALTLGDANTDSSTFNGGITATAPSGVTLAGTIETDGNAISIGDGDTAITLAANTIIDGDANNDQVTDGAITLGGTVDGASTLTLNSTNTTTISAAIGSGTDITSLITDSGGTTVISADITSTGNQTYNDNVSLTTDITLTGGSQLTFAGTVNSSATDETTDADALSTSFTETAFEGEVGGTYGLGVIIITGALDLDAAITSASSLSVSTTSNLAADVTTSGAQQYDGAVTLSADNTLTTTTDSNATFGSTIDSDDASTKRDLTLTLGSGSASVTGIVGATSLDVLTLNSSSSFTAAVTATSIVNAASKTATFSDNVTANITNSGTLLFDTSADKSVTGTIAEPGDGATGTEIKVIDSADGAPATVTFTATIAADTLTVGTSSKAGAALFEDDVTVPTINITGGDVDAEDSTVTFNTAVTSSSGITLDDNTGDAKVIFDQNNTVNIASTIDGGADNEGTIQVTGATKTFTSAIGGTYDVGTLDIDNTSIFNEAISATNINVASGITATAKKAITATAIVLDGGTLELSTTTTATIAGTINGNDTTEGVLHISGANKTFSGAIGTSRILTEIDIDGATIFNGTIKTVTLDTAAAAYALELNGAANVITNAVTFNNTGALTLGDANTDSSTFNGGITATAPSGVTLAGTIETDGNAISIGDGDTAITLAANTIIDGDANNDQVTDGAITLGGTVDGASTLTLNSTNTTTISAAIGSGTDITSLITDSGGTTVISADITSTGNQTYNDNVSLTTDITLTGGSQLTFAGTVNSSATDETTDADALSTSFTETAFEGEVGGTYGLGVIIITGALDLRCSILLVQVL